jgi:hypothetical protein
LCLCAAYIINQSDEYQYAIAICIVEYWIEAIFFPSIKDFLLIKLIGKKKTKSRRAEEQKRRKGLCLQNEDVI